MDTLLAAATPATTLADSGVEALLEGLSDNIELVIIFGIGGVVAIIAIVFGTISSTANRKETERTKREIAAYVAEGSMTSDDAERLLRSDQTPEDA